jgi:NAD+ diphosphatase
MRRPHAASLPDRPACATFGAMGRMNFYSGVGLDRADHLRGDETWLKARFEDPSTRFVAVWRSRNLMAAEATTRALWLQGEAATALMARAENVTFLGLNEERAYVALDLSRLEAPEQEAGLAGRGAFHDLRAVGPLMARHEGALLAYARGLMHWHRRHRFCGVCGSPTESRRGGHLRLCLDPDCGTPHFPRTDPAVIMLVHDGAHCLLGRQKIWPPGMHSTLAGFVEPGESLEEAVAREVEEEVGLKLDLAGIAYHSSQPWPFPSSIMLGFHALTAKAEPRVNPEEIESATWFSRDELLNSPEDETFKLPRVDSIARRLIEDWLAETA